MASKVVAKQINYANDVNDLNIPNVCEIEILKMFLFGGQKVTKLFIIVLLTHNFTMCGARRTSRRRGA